MTQRIQLACLSYYWCFHRSLSTMKNEEIAALFVDMKNSFKEYSETQFEKFTDLLNQHCVRTDEKLSKLSPSSPMEATEAKSQSGLQKPGGEMGSSSAPRASWGSESREMDTIIKGLRVKVG